MIEYIKMIILALICGATVALPTSSATHFSFVNSVVGFSDDGRLLGFYYAIFSVAFALAVLVLLRKIYFTGIRAVFSKDKKLLGYKKVIRNIVVSLIPVLLLFIPTGEGELVMDQFDKFLTKENLLLVSFASIISALVLVISMWYTRQGYAETKRMSDLKSTIRMSVYQLISYVIPGASKVSSAATNILISDVDSKVAVREIYLYIAPQMLLVNIVKIIRFVMTDAIIDPVTVVIAAAVVLVMSFIIISVMSRINIRRLFVFFSIYSAVFGIAAAVLSFIIK